MNQVVGIVSLEGTVSTSLVVSDSFSLHDYVIQLHTLSGHDFAV